MSDRPTDQLADREPVFPQPPPLPRGRDIDLPGRGSTFVRDVAAPRGRKRAPAVILLHGWTVTADLNFFRCFGPLATKYRVVALDQRGHGRGIKATPFRLEDCADDVAALIDELELVRPIVVGYSMGGGVAQLVAQRHADAIRGVVLCATAHRFGGQFHDQVWRKAVLDSVTAVVSRIPPDVRARINHSVQARREPQNPREAWMRDEIANHDPAMVLQGLQELTAFDSLPWLGDLDIPISVIRTTRDLTVPTADQNVMIDALTEPDVFDVDAPHRAAVEAADLFVPALLEAIDRIEVRTTRAPARRRVTAAASESARRRPRRMTGSRP
jgi:3-oxoadipate enol-lactonase